MTPMKIPALLIASCLWLCAAAACNPLAPQPDRTQYFILSPAPQSAAVAVPSQSTSQLSLGVGPIGFPGYLKRPWVVTRASSDRLLVSDDKRWGEPLDRNFESILCENLSRILGTERVRMYPWYSDVQVDYQVEVRVERFEASQDGRSQLTAVWTIKDGKDGRELASSEARASAPVQGDDPAGSAALSQDLGEMSRQIADRIIQLNDTSARRRAAHRSPVPNPNGIGFLPS
jgi:uncharacterized lipoprotein YmbA